MTTSKGADPLSEADDRDEGPARPIWIAPDADALREAGAPPPAVAWMAAQGKAPKPGSHLLLPGADGKAVGAVLVPDPAQPLAAGALARALPPGAWRFAGEGDATLHRLAFALGRYRFARYLADEQPPMPRLDELEPRTAAVVDGVHLARDLVNTPTADMGPAELEAAARDLAEAHGAHVEATAGDALAEGFPMVHAVGRASASPPRLIDMRWGESGPRVTLVGKGVCFDTGGLDIKPASNMLLMKKDMGGAAAVLGLASIIMAAKLAVRLRVLVPAVENAIAGNAFRPGDVLRSRKGVTVEIGNTDAEGRLILADALALADEEAPDLMIDMATLTGAARVALGPDVPPFFTHDDALAARIEAAAAEARDPVWRLPLHRPYRRMLKSEVADMSNVGGGGMAGAITAALFLDRFVEKAGAHVHFDIFGWCPEARPHCPKGGEAQAIRGLFAMIEAQAAGAG